MCSYWRFKSLQRSFLFSLCFLKCFGIISSWNHTVIRSLDTFPRPQHCALYVTNLRIASPEITKVHCTSFAREQTSILKVTSKEVQHTICRNFHVFKGICDLILRILFRLPLKQKRGKVITIIEQSIVT